MWSPFFSRESSTVEMAAMPEEQIRVFSPFSRKETAAPSSSRFGLAERL